MYHPGMNQTIPSDRTAEQALAARFRALSEEKRLWILQLLRGRERCVCELQASVGVSQSLLSFHLKILRDAGIVTGRRSGRWVYYSIDETALEGMVGFLETLELWEPAASNVVDAKVSQSGGCCR